MWRMREVGSAVKASRLRVQNFCGLEIRTDDWTDARVDRVLPIIEGEQQLLCEALELHGSERILDAGSGSGVLGLYAASKGCYCVGVDVAARAVKMARENAQANGLNVKFVRQRYGPWSADAESYDLVISNPPHNPTPRGVRVPLHGDGGNDGLRVFSEFARAAHRHLIPSGQFIFLQLSLSAGGTPKVLEILTEAFANDVSVTYSRVLPTVSSQWFLTRLYGADHRAWSNCHVRAYPQLDLVIGRATKTPRRGVTVEEERRRLTSRTWEEIVEIHRLVTLGQ